MSIPLKTEICNLALSHLAVGKEVGNLETEKSQEAEACRRFYDLALKRTLQDAPWSFATKIISLALVQEGPNSEWNYSYRYPNDCLKMIKILSGVRNDTRQSRVRYEIGQDSAGLLIYTDQESAEMKYTMYADNPVFYPPDFVMAFSYYLASLIAPRITGGDNKLGDRALKLYFAEMQVAKIRNITEEQLDEEPDSEFIRERL